MVTWAEAFTRQAASDLKTYEYLTKSGLPQSHSLHYLQMWLEKLCKSYIYEGSIEELKWKHQVIEKILPRMIQDYWQRIGFTGSPSVNEMRALCREIDLLHPQPDDDGKRRDNVEYPWPENTGTVVAPSEWKFPIGARLHSPSGRKLIKAAKSLTQSKLNAI
ncbi:hypothetical protein [Terracidiphilus sp.]|jgi:hypothetical protein|uniref:hypothetical protein n=1 Tax=Terracidiphilus sp. TaxID=1964191 RepID=UPI003C188F17